MLPEIMVIESGEMSKQVISSEWPLKVVMHVRIFGSQTFTLVSREPEDTILEFFVMQEH